MTYKNIYRKIEVKETDEEVGAKGNEGRKDEAKKEDWQHVSVQTPHSPVAVAKLELSPFPLWAFLYELMGL